MTTLVPKILIAKNGFDALTAAPENLRFSSDYETIKVVHSDAPVESGRYAHGLSYIPAYIASAMAMGSSTIAGFVGQYSAPSPFEAGFGCDPTYFYYWTQCKYLLIAQETI